MKKCICILFCLVFFCSGCNKKSSAVTFVTSGLSFTANVSFNGNSQSYDVVFKDESVKVASRETGMSAEFSNGKTTLEYDGISHVINTDSLPSALIIDLFYYLKTGAENNTAVLKNNEYIIKYRTSKYNFEVTLAETGLPLSVSETNFGIKITVTNTKMNQ